MPVTVGLADEGKAVSTNTTALGGNTAYSGMEWQPRHIAEYHVYLYNVSARTFPKAGPYEVVNIPGVTDTDPYLPGMKANEKYHYVTSFPQPMLMPKFDSQTSEIGQIRVDARRYVMDIVNPDNKSLDLNTIIPDKDVFSVGNNLSQKGVFFALTNPPTIQDVRAAYDRMEAYYNGLRTRAQTLEVTNKAQLNEELGSNPDFAYMAEYFGESFTWRRKGTRPEECPNCGEQKPFGRKFHVNKELGFICVEPSVAGWQAAVQAGVKTKAEAKEAGFDWWTKGEKPS